MNNQRKQTYVKVCEIQRVGKIKEKVPTLKSSEGKSGANDKLHVGE